MRYFYDSIVEEVLPQDLNTRARNSANDAVRDMTRGEVIDYLKSDAQLNLKLPLSFVSSSYFHVSCFFK